MSQVLYLHGKGGSPAEAEHYRPLFPGREVVGLDYRGAPPWEAGAEIRRAVLACRKIHGDLFLIANSVGAYYLLHAGVEKEVSRAWFLSPLVDMERMIRDLLRSVGATETDLRERGRIPTPFGEDLSWDVLSYVRSHPVRWSVPTHILCGGRDDLVPFETVAAFARAHRARLTVMKEGGHWFHTEAEMAFLDGWIRNTVHEAPGLDEK